MQKTLRSIIHEKIPLELRFQLELLSRKRNLINEEKHEKIIELLREFDIKGVVQLGPGTNRYAIKIDGYVVKIATDNDGKIDNLKEFKMAKRLYPYVTKTYEVSENGTLLVAEYISPFSSYQEMTRYADKIREILMKLSSTYLIGDVGITPKNYANWGLRAGSSEPVCLDFAYVYEVSSELFICRDCKTNSMLVPDKDFKRLNCSNPMCGKEYSFEDIRAKIGNDLHRHEIGDLTEEGYYLTSSNVPTELSEQRSNYLVKKKPKQEHSKKLEINEEDTSMSKHIENAMAVAKAMTANDPFQLPVIRATARVASLEDSKRNIIKATARVAEPKVVSEPDENIAFSGSIEDTPDVDIETVVQVVKDGYKNNSVNMTDVIQVPEIPDVVEEFEPVVIKATARVADEVAVKESKPEATKSKTSKKSKNEINDWYIKNMKRAFSKISNRISKFLHMTGQFDEVRQDVKDIKYPADYYKNVQNAVFRSLVSFCNFTVTNEPNEKGKGNRKIFTPPTDILGTKYEPTMIFMARVWNNREINTVEDPGMMDAYRERYDDYLGIQREWLEVFKERLAFKMKISANGIEKITNVIAAEWCVPVTDAVEHDNQEDTASDVAEKVANIPEEEPDEIDQLMINEDEAENDGSTVPMEEIMTAEEAAEAAMADDEDVVFSGSTGIDVIQSPNHDEEDEKEYEDDDEEAPEYLSVEIYHEDDYDIIRINTEEFFGPVSIPFYTNLADINGNNNTPSIADDRNGVWDWLIHMVPDLMFTTNDPDRWLKFNTVEPEVNQPHAVIMDEDRGVYTMGIYFLKGIFDIDDDGNMNAVFDEELLKKINKLIIDDIGYSRISHLRRSLNTNDLIYDENYVISMMQNLSDDDDDEEEDIVENSDVENAAVAAMMDEENAATDNQEVSPAVDVDETVPEEVAFGEPFRGHSSDNVSNTEGTEEVQEGTGEPEGTGEKEETDGDGRVSAPEGMVTTFKPIRRITQ